MHTLPGSDVHCRRVEERNQPHRRASRKRYLNKSVISITTSPPKTVLKRYMKATKQIDGSIPYSTLERCRSSPLIPNARFKKVNGYTLLEKHVSRPLWRVALHPDYGQQYATFSSKLAAANFAAILSSMRSEHAANIPYLEPPCQQFDLRRQVAGNATNEDGSEYTSGFDTLSIEAFIADIDSAITEVDNNVAFECNDETISDTADERPTSTKCVGNVLFRVIPRDKFKRGHTDASTPAFRKPDCGALFSYGETPFALVHKFRFAPRLNYTITKRTRPSKF